MPIRSDCRHLAQARGKALRDVNLTQVMAYYEIGREIVEFEQKGKRRAGYGEELIVKLAKDMVHPGFSYWRKRLSSSLSAEFSNGYGLSGGNCCSLLAIDL